VLRGTILLCSGQRRRSRARRAQVCDRPSAAERATRSPEARDDKPKEASPSWKPLSDRRPQALGSRCCPGFRSRPHHLACSSTMQREPPLDPQNPRWSETSDVIPMFPRSCGRSNSGTVREAMAHRRSQRFARLRRDLPPLAPGQGWQSVQSLHELDDSGISFLPGVHASCGILRFLKIGYDGVPITACWATVLSRGAAHPMHQHPIIS